MKYILTTILTLFLLSSCKDYLKDELLSETSADFLYNTPAGITSAVTGLYNLNRDLYENSEWNYARAVTIQAKSDLVFGRTGEIALYSFLSWGASINDFGTRRYSDFWRHYYRLVDRSNAVIKAAEENAEMDEVAKRQAIAEAKCMRANSYFTLYRLFNNIFITTEPTTPENAFVVPSDKSSEAEIFALLNSDLNYAIDNLDWTTPEFGRWTQASARHLKAKVAVWQKDWTEAAAQADAVINNENYSLVSETKDVFEGDMNHSETLFAIQYEDGVIGGSSSNRIHFNFIAQYNRAQGADFSIANGGRGAGFLLLNDYLRGLLAEDPNDNRDDGTYYISAYTYNNPDDLPEGVKLGDTIKLYNQYSDDASEYRQYYLVQNPGTLKFLQEDAVPSEANTISNIMIYRLAETYLIGAEAHMELGHTDQALEYLNAVRNRAHAASLTTIDQQTIMDERARELAFEGQRWFTIKRMGVLVSQIEKYAGNDNWRNIARTRIKPHMVNWPIPESELDLLGAGYPQNEGY